MRRRVWVAGVAALALLLGVWLQLTLFGEAEAVLLSFKPPAVNERRAAIGDVHRLSPRLRRVFDPAADFAPIAEPSPSDWLAKHHEGGQTFEQFVQAVPNRPNKQRNTNQRQWLTGCLLRLLEQRLPADAYCLLGITLTDLNPEPAWNYVFGQASLRQRVGVDSFARFGPVHSDGFDLSSCVILPALGRSSRL